MKTFLVVLASLAFLPDAKAAQKYLSAVKEVIEEIRPKPSMKEIEAFLQAAPTVDTEQPLEKSAARITKFIFEDSKISADNSYLSRVNKDNILPDSVISLKQGHCVGLTILFLLIAEKSDLTAYLVRGPDHVFPRLCDKTKCINLEMLKNGEVKTDEFYTKNLMIPKEALGKKLYLANLDSADELKASIYLGLGYVTNKSGQKDLAELFYSKAVENSENFAEPHSNLAAIYAESGRLDEARKSLKKALDINPIHYASLINLAALEQNKGNDDSALTYLGKALEANPISVQAYRKRASIYKKKKDFKNSSLDLDRILLIEPRFCDVMKERLEFAKQGIKSLNPNLETQLSLHQKKNTCLQLPAN